MKHRRSRVPQTGAVNIRITHDTANTNIRKGPLSQSRWRVSRSSDGECLAKTIQPNTRMTVLENSSQQQKPHEQTAGQSWNCLYKDDIQNTKVIYFDSSKSHNLQKMKDIKQIIQRKYANRKKIHNIFSEWDQDHKGEISPENAQVILNSMGIEVDLQETREFVKYVSGQRNAITLNDFLGMLYEIRPNEVFEKHSQPITLEPPKPVFNPNRVFALLRNKKQEIERCLSDCGDSVTYERFRMVLERAGANDLSEFECKTVYDKFTKDNRFLESKDFLSEVSGFKVEINHCQPEQVKVMDSKAKSLAKYRHINMAKDSLNDINQASICKMPAPDLEANVTNAELFKTRIRKYISRKEEFRLIEDTLLSKNQVVSYEQLRNCMVDLMKSVSEPIRPKQLQGFLNMFIYNAANETLRNQVAQVIYDEHSLNYHHRVDRQPRSIPVDSNPNQQTIPGDAPPTDLNVNIRRKIEKSLLFPDGKCRQVFKSLDLNNDGYLGRQELAQAMTNRKILDRSQSEQLVGWIAQHSQSKQHLNFSEFGAVVRQYINQDQNMEQPYPILAKKRRIHTDKSPPRFDMHPTSVNFNQRKTRLGATPTPAACPFKNINAKDDWGSPGNEDSRLQYQREEKRRSDCYKQNRLASIQRYRSSEALRLQLLDEKAVHRQIGTLKRLGEQQWAYHHVNHLKNQWK